VSWALAEGKSPLQVGQYVGKTAQMIEKIYAHTNEGLQRETANVIGRGTYLARPTISHRRASKGVNRPERGAQKPVKPAGLPPKLDDLGPTMCLQLAPL
jgi:hypothetical protein